MTIVTLTFDDGLDSHLDAGLATLNRHGIRGTFYLPIASDTFARRHHDWRAAAAQGHELGNHTIFHPGVSAKSWVTEGIALERYSADRMLRELDVANSVLRTLDGRSERTFAFPCSNPWLGRSGWPRRAVAGLGLERTRLMGWIDRIGIDWASSKVDYTPLVSKLFVAARCGGSTVEALPLLPRDRHRIRGVEGDGLNAAALNALLDTAIIRQCWLVLVFHGIGDGRSLSCELDAFERLVARLASEPQIEVLTFLDAAKRLWA